jgi:DNA-directed RNA polymerase
MGLLYPLQAGIQGENENYLINKTFFNAEWWVWDAESRKCQIPNAKYKWRVPNKKYIRKVIELPWDILSGSC